MLFHKISWYIYYNTFIQLNCTINIIFKKWILVTNHKVFIAFLGVNVSGNGSNLSVNISDKITKNRFMSW